LPPALAKTRIEAFLMIKHPFTIATAILASTLGTACQPSAKAPAPAAVAESPAHAPDPAPNTAGDAGSIRAGQTLSADFIKTAPPVEQVVADIIPVTGKLALDKQQLRIASARVAGRLGRIFVFEGQSVKAGDALAEIYSPEFVSAEREFILARQFRDAIAKSGTDNELIKDAASTFDAASNKLKVLGASPEDIAHLVASGVADEYLKVRAPISGVVIQRNVDPGGYLNVGDSLMSLANTTTLWLFFNTYDSDYASIQLGQSVSFETSSLPGKHFDGRIAFIAPSIDPATHTLPVRCDVPNPQFQLRPEMFVTGMLNVGERNAWVVPRTAVIHIRDTDYVIVKRSDNDYQRIAVHGHPIDDGQYAITQGITEAIPIVIDGSLLLNEIVNES